MAESRRRRTEDRGRQPGTENGLPIRKPPGLRRARAEYVAKERAEATKRCCKNCAYSMRPMGKWFRILLAGFPGLLACFNHPEEPGRMRETGCHRVCRNFRLRCPPAVRLDPPEPPNDLVCCVALTKGQHAFVDLEDFAWINRHKWSAYWNGHKWYAGRTEKGKAILMHRQIMHAPKGSMIDHIDGNGLNNCKSNLRFCTSHQNNCNRRPGGKSSQYKGVYFDKRRRKYYAVAQYKSEQIEFGPFDNEIDAARAYDRAAIQYHGEFAYLNFPHEWPPERRQEIMAKRQEITGTPKGKGRKFRMGMPVREKYRRKAGRSTTKGEKATKTARSKPKGKTRAKSPGRSRPCGSGSPPPSAPRSNPHS